MNTGLRKQLGYAPEDRLLILHADDFGITAGSNQAIMDLLHGGGITSASLMVLVPPSMRRQIIAARTLEWMLGCI